ncbi:MAG: Fe-S cluster assembly ATPase SufC [Candidatus Micrarchaeota archaeon]
MLVVENLHVEVKGKVVLNGVNMKIPDGETHVLLGPNGSGKSSLAAVLMGNLKYKVVRGKISFQEKNLLKLSPEERAKLGLFLAFQNPVEIPGINIFNFLYHSCKARGASHSSIFEFKKKADEAARVLGLSSEFLNRDLNVGFSGGEKKRIEALQLLLAQPKLAIIDEIDSGLDVDGLKAVAIALRSLENHEFSSLIITHHAKLLHFLKPDKVHVLKNGVIVKTGGQELISYVEKNGYGELQ